MAYDPASFDRLVSDTRLRATQAAIIAREQEAQERLNTELANKSVVAEISKAEELQLDAVRVAARARFVNLPENAILGRFIPKYIGWLVHSEFNAGQDIDFYNITQWSWVRGTVLTTDGELKIIGPVNTKRSDFPLSLPEHHINVLRRSKQLTPITDRNINDGLKDYRGQLASFVIRKGL